MIYASERGYTYCVCADGRNLLLSPEIVSKKGDFSVDENEDELWYLGDNNYDLESDSCRLSENENEVEVRASTSREQGRTRGKEGECGSVITRRYMLYGESIRFSLCVRLPGDSCPLIDLCC